MGDKIRVLILEDHLLTLDGYRLNLSNIEDIDVVYVLRFAEQLLPALAAKPIDLILMDVNVPISPENKTPFPILQEIPAIFQLYPEIAIVVISMFNSNSLIKNIIKTGVNGYYLKDDEALTNLPAIIRKVVNEKQFCATQSIWDSVIQPSKVIRSETNELTSRQLEVLSLIAAYPDMSTTELASRLGVANSTVRNLMSTAYLKLNVHSKTAAVEKVRQMGGIVPVLPNIEDEISQA
jgi:DNA-binding NarL/FixJ family response regulator